MKPAKEKKPFVSVAEAAKIIGVGPVEVRRLIRAGRIRAEPIGPVYAVYRESAENFERNPVGRPKSQ